MYSPNGSIIVFFSMVLLAVAAVLTTAIFLAAWERTRVVGMAILSFFAVVIVLGLVWFLSAARHGDLHADFVHRGWPESVDRQPGRRVGAVAQRESREHRPLKNGDVVQPEATDTPNAAGTASSDEAGETSENGNRSSAEGARRPATPPHWVVDPPGRSGAVFRRVITSDPFSTDDECYRQVEDKMLVTTCRYVSDRVGNSWNRELRRHESLSEQPPDLARQYLDRLGVDPAYLWKHVCAEPEYREWVTSSVDTLGDSLMGPMRRIHVLMEIDEGVQRDLVSRWRQSVLVHRLGIVGGGAAAVLALVGVIFAYLKIDTATRGFYSRRLQLVAAAVTILIVLVMLRMHSTAPIKMLPKW